MIKGSFYLTLLCLLLFDFVIKAQNIGLRNRDSIGTFNLPPVSDHQYVLQKHYHSLSQPGFDTHDTLAKKRFGRAAGGLIIVEMTPWLVDRYIRHVDYANISFQTLADNLKPGSWTWDGDGFTTNQFGHPYHGSLFYNAFRVNGYNFWKSSLAVFAGSYLWETAAENQAPAPNDLINTGFGGIIMGEMTYRFSNKIINNHSRGFRRQASEVLALIISPMNGFNRIVHGNWGKVTNNSVKPDSSALYTEFDIGLRKFSVNNKDDNFGMYGHLKILYGTPFENYKTPFSNILINTEFGKDDSSIINMVNIAGSLTGWRIQAKKKFQHHLLLTANYDYIRNKAFFYSGQSVKLNLYSGFELTRKLKISTTIGAGFVVLASVPDPYLYKSRYYDYCSGLGFNGGCTFSIANLFFYSLNYRGGWLKTINGNSSQYFLHAITSEVRFRIINEFSICAEPGYFTLKGNYNCYDDVKNIYPYVRVSARYSFNVK